ncbi:MAG TPA: two-component system sensor histidine kinase AtoS [Patescibacteria group bacterium]|nr:two-component system sensor histidine kinase AtoS [Patescibacteria group bacterium]
MIRCWPQTLRYQLIVITLLAVTIPMFFTGYVVKKEAENALLDEKRVKLFGFARLLDASLGEGYEKILAEKNASGLDRAGQIALLNAALREQCDIIAQNEPGVGVGYYSKKLDAIITYAPSVAYEKTIGLPIAPLHPGRRVMETGENLVEFGPLVRGNIMNAMIPIQRDQEIIGYIWANELTDDVQAQLAVMDRKIYTFGGLGIVLSLSLLFFLLGKFVNDVETIKQGLQNLKFDLRYRIPLMKGETGEIVAGIHNMAQTLEDIRSVNENILHSIADGVITVDMAGRITTINPAAREMTGYQPVELVGQLYRDVFCGGNGFHSLLLDTLGSGANHVALETEYPVKNRSLYVSISTSQLKDSDDRMIGAVVVFKDLTEKHRLEEQICRADRLASLGEMMAGIAHEIRNPLTSVKGFVQYLQELDDEAERREYMPIIVKEVDRANRVIDELLYFARPTHTEYQTMDMNEVLTNTLFLVKNKTTTHRVDFVLRLAERLPAVRGDAGQIRQVLLNLLINAIQAIPENGRVEITTCREREQIVIEIRDNGSGIPEGDQMKVFDPFFTTKPTGTGLGLAIAQRIVSAHRGSLSISSQMGQGTAVTVEIPVWKEGSGKNEG